MSQMYEPAHEAFRDSALAALAPAMTPGLSDVTVMMVDDEPMMIEVTQAFLEDAGYRRFVSVTDPRLALPTARAKRPGLILLDLMMPGMNGFEVLQQIRDDETLRYTPVIVLTAASDPANKLRALELGATEILAKPVDESELKIRVRNSLTFKLYQDRLANDDPVTGLPNRRVFVERLQAAMATTLLRGERHLALLHVNLDRFAQVNDTLGHRAGDALLSAVADRLREVAQAQGHAASSALRRPPLLARLGGDEFALMASDIDGPSAAGGLAREVVRALGKPFKIDGRELFITPSIGIAMHPEDAADEATLMRHAGMAMKYAKSGGRNSFQYYSAKLNSASLERLVLETELRQALQRQELMLYYQPKIDLTTGALVGSEALMRWKHPRLGLVAPGRFIPIAEENGLIIEIGEWVVNEACRQMRQWREDCGRDVKVAVNVARHGLVSGNLAETVSRALDRHHIEPGRLVLELTESMLMDRVDVVSEKLRRFRELGVELSIDDFGTGYSSMSYLKCFPVQELKIDRSFVKDLAEDRTDAAIVQALIALGHSLGMRVVAEGVETEVQRSKLASMGCDNYQGFLCSPALPPQEFVAKLDQLDRCAPPGASGSAA